MPPYYHPVHEIEHGSFKAMVWKRNFEHGVRYTATFARLHRSGESWLLTEALGRDDLLSLLTRGDSRRIREAAAAGLARLADPGLAPQLLAAWRARRILRDCAAAALAALPSPADLRLALHHSDDPDERDLAARIDAAAVDR